jgi:hypothetical protein
VHFILKSLVCISLVSSLVAQTSLVGGSLVGTVSDPGGGRIPSVTVDLRDPRTSRLREVTTDSQGEFRVSELPAGTYEVSVSQPGFAPYRHAGVNVALGTTVQLDISLQSATLATQVTVSAQPSPIDLSQTSVTNSVDTERIEELPVGSRNYLNFVLLAPGVTASTINYPNGTR